MSITLHSTATLRADIALPASKSISNRALIIYALTRPERMDNAWLQEQLQHLSDCDDTQVMIRALTQMPPTIDIMAAGTAMRFLTAYLSVTPGTHVITGTERMRQRPIGILVDALRTLGARIDYVEREGFPPLRISGGQHRGGELTLPGSVSSQYISALLMIGPVLEEGLRLTLTGNIVSRPYIDMTLSIMRQFGASAEWTGADQLQVLPGGYIPQSYLVESDWSAASYWYEMMALTPDPAPQVCLSGLFRESLQGDAAVQHLFFPLGVRTDFYRDENGVECVRLSRVKRTVKRLEYDFVAQPDLAQTLVVACVMLDIPFRFTGLQSLKIKETDRIRALRTELEKLGYDVREAEDSILYWEGTRRPALSHPAMDTYEDHRMAMSLAPVCLKRETITINHPEVVSKSYPGFWEDMAAVCHYNTEQ